MDADDAETATSNTARPSEDGPLPDNDGNENDSAPLTHAQSWALKGRIIEAKDRADRAGLQPRELGVTFPELTVRAVSADASIHENVLSQFNVAQAMRASRTAAPEKTILDRVHGCVKPGEMLLVLGRPGAGCTTLLSVLANRRRGYTAVEGDVFYGSLAADEAKPYRGQIVMNTEEELFFPTLTVGQTMAFATQLKVPYSVPADVTDKSSYSKANRNFLLESMKIEHTQDTKVGNEFVRGVSGGERKRVSIAETLATRGSVFCWDNSTRGLDASTALEWTKAIRAMTDVLGLATIVTLYQAGNGIYQLFDKVLVLDEGQEVYYGPRTEALPFMEDLGFICQDGANVADFLTGVTVPTERRVRPECQDSFPRTAAALRAAYELSPIYAQMRSEYDYPTTDEARDKTELFREGVAQEKHHRLPQRSPLTVGFRSQMAACITRQYQVVWGDKPTFIIKQASTLIQALIVGSLFYNAPDTSAGLFLKSGALFFSLLFNTLLSMSEVTDSFSSRTVLLKHKMFAYFHPAVFCLAQIAADIPMLLIQISFFSIVLYFMVGLTTSAGAFFTYWILLFSTTMVRLDRSSLLRREKNAD